MPITPLLTEANWKAHGLTLRTTVEKVKKPKTGISEALRKYATAERLPMVETRAKGAALDNIEKALAEAKPTHRGNVPFVTRLTNMEQAVVTERRRLDAEIQAVSLEEILRSQVPKFYAFCQSERCTENMDFLRDLKARKPIPVLIHTYIDPNGSGSINIPDTIRRKLLADQTNASLWKEAHAEIMRLLKSDTMSRYKKELSKPLKE